MNYHTMNAISLSSDTESQISGAIYTCYYLDKLLSSLLLRPPSLPMLQVKPAQLIQLDSDLPLSAIIKAMVELAQIQEVTLNMTFKTTLSDETGQEATIDGLVQDMYNMHAEHQKARTDQPSIALRLLTEAIATAQPNFQSYAIRMGSH